MKDRFYTGFFYTVSLAVILTACVFYFLNISVSARIYGNTDFFTFYQSMRFYFAGQNLYSPIFSIFELPQHTALSGVSANGNLNPPFLTLILLCLYDFNYADAVKIWTAGSIILMLASIALLVYAFPFNKKYRLAAAAGFVIYAPNASVFCYGQISHYILILLTGAFLLGSQKKDIPAGVLIGLACSLKIFCGLFLLYFLAIKRLKLFLSAVITTAGCFTVSMMVFGKINTLQYRKVFNTINWYSASWNSSFLGFFTRVFSSVEQNKAFINLPRAVPSLTFIFSSLLIFYLLYAWRKLGSRHFDAGFSLTIISMLLLSPLGWSYYFGFLIIPYCVLIYKSRNDCLHFIACIALFFSSLAGNLLKTPQIITAKQIFYNGGVGFYTLIILLILYFYMIEKYQYLINILPEKAPVNVFSENNWRLIYSAVFIPSLASQFFLINRTFSQFF